MNVPSFEKSSDRMPNALPCALVSHQLCDPAAGSVAGTDPLPLVAVLSSELFASLKIAFRRLVYETELIKVLLWPRVPVPATAVTVMLTLTGSV